MRIEAFLEQSAMRFPDKTALICGEQRTTYSELNRLANRVALRLNRNGIERGDRVVIFLENSLEAVITIFGVLKAGAVFSMVNPTTKAKKLAYILSNLQATCLLFNARSTSVAAEALAHIRECFSIVVGGEIYNEFPTRHVSWDTFLNSGIDHNNIAVHHGGIDQDLAYVFYTSGSTGFPKGVMMTHQNVDCGTASIIQYLQNTPDDIVLSVLPLSFDYGLHQIFMTCRVASTLILEKSFTFPYPVIRKMETEGVTGFPLVPTIASILLHMKALKSGSLPQLRYITNTAAPMPPAHSRRLLELFPNVQLYLMYGMTENIRGTYLPPEEVLIRPESVGKAIPNTEAYLVDTKGERIKPGMTGELVIRGGHIMKGYWDNPEATAQVLRPGIYPWEKVLYTGDIFRTDEQGYFYFVGRQDDFIKTRGEKVSPKEVENALYELEGVREAAVVPVPDPILGHALKAIIVAADGFFLREQDILRHCSTCLEDYMIPKFVEFRTMLPKTESGKIHRREIQPDIDDRH